MPSNAGVNPSLSITAVAERPMASILTNDGTTFAGGVGYQNGHQQ